MSPSARSKDPLHAALKAKQIALGYSDTEMAAILDIPRTTYSGVKVERNRITLGVARKIVAAFPDLADAALAQDWTVLPS